MNYSLNLDLLFTIENFFWQLSWKEKQVYIRNHVKKIDVQQKIVIDKISRRSGSFKYYLSPNTGDLKPVCKQMFLNTLGMKEWMVQNWASSTVVSPDDEEAQHSEQEDGAILPKDVIEQCGYREKKIPQKKKIISEWFESLPKVPSHYCRASTSKMYLEPLWDTKIDLYRSYKDFGISHNILYLCKFLKKRIYPSSFPKKISVKLVTHSKQAMFQRKTTISILLRKIGLELKKNGTNRRQLMVKYIA